MRAEIGSSRYSLFSNIFYINSTEVNKQKLKDRNKSLKYYYDKKTEKGYLSIHSYKKSNP